MQEEDITRAILRYMLDHPDACDTMEGITQWWVMQGAIDLNMDRATKVVHELVDQRLLVEKSGADAGKVYCINKERMGQIEAFL